MTRNFWPSAILLPVLLLLQGCDINYATFVTSTHIGIKADTNTEQVAIGIGRTDLFVGPGYPEKGTAPSAFGYLQTDAQVFSPQLTQLYATGDAADAVTQTSNTVPSGTPKPVELSGVRRPLVFGTNTDVGLKVGFVANTPSSFTFGYDRQEVSIIPMQPKLSGSSSDTYAPVLAAITLNVATNTPANTGITLGQFFATGTAATNLAGTDRIRGLFQAAAIGQIDQAVLHAAVITLGKNVATVKAFLDSGNGYASNCSILKARPAFHSELWDVADPCALQETDFINTLNRRPELTSAAVSALSPTP